MPRIPSHIGIIPDGNRRWASQQGLNKEDGYVAGLEPGLRLLRLCRDAGVDEVTFYGFTVDNTKRPSVQRRAFTHACIEAVRLLGQEAAQLRVLGNTASAMFPPELLPYTQGHAFGGGGIKVNFLVNYGWQWGLEGLQTAPPGRDCSQWLRSAAVSRIDLIIRWGGRRRLSGFLPVQSVYADFYVVDEHWPDFQPDHLHAALEWYQRQDVTLGG